MPLVDSLNNFRSSITEANGFISIAFQQDASGTYLLPQNQRDFITDSAFLKMFIAWETFLESIFIKYMLGELSILGTMVPRFVQPSNKDHALQILIGTQKYVDWSNPEIVKRLSNIYFANGNHIDIFISSIFIELFDLKTIRNAAAHLSTTTGKQLDSLGSRLLNLTQANLTVSQLIFTSDPSGTGGTTFLSTYLTKLDITAEGIANG